MLRSSIRVKKTAPAAFLRGRPGTDLSIEIHTMHRRPLTPLIMYCAIEEWSTKRVTSRTLNGSVPTSIAGVLHWSP
jgi:hypothetical protein